MKILIKSSYSRFLCNVFWFSIWYYILFCYTLYMYMKPKIVYFCKYFHTISSHSWSRLNMAKILPIQRKTLYNQSINILGPIFIFQFFMTKQYFVCEKFPVPFWNPKNVEVSLERLIRICCCCCCCYWCHKHFTFLPSFRNSLRANVTQTWQKAPAR